MDISNQIKEVIWAFPLLKYSPERNELFGELYISEFDSYQIRIDLNPYPKFFPNLYETEERIPNKLDRHIYTDTGSCCLTTRAKAQVLLKTKISSLKIFIKEIVIPYLQNNSYFEINKRYKTDEYAHHHQGVIDSYKDILKITDEKLLALTLNNRLNSPKLKIHHLCYCGSGIIMKKCSNGLHDKAYRDFKLIDKELIYNDLRLHFIPILKQKGFIK